MSELKPPTKTQPKRLTNEELLRLTPLSRGEKLFATLKKPQNTPSVTKPTPLQVEPTHEERVAISRQAVGELQDRVAQRRAQEQQAGARSTAQSNAQRAPAQATPRVANSNERRAAQQQSANTNSGLSFEDEFPDIPKTTPTGNAKYVLLGIDGVHMGKVFPVTKNGVTIGSASANDIVMPHGIGVNAKHAIVKPGLRNVQINLTKDSHVHVDGEEHSMNFLKRGLSKARLGTIKLPLGSGIAFGPDGTEHEMLLLPASKDAALSANNWSLFAVDGPHKGTKFNLDFGNNVIGTDANSHVKLSKGGAKSQHAKITIERDEDGDVVLNLNKLQGKVKSTQIIEDEIYHDQPVEQEEQINAGYKIQIGKHKFVLLPPSKQTASTQTTQSRTEQNAVDDRTEVTNQPMPRSGGKLKKFAKAALFAGAIAGLGYGAYKGYKHFGKSEENKPVPVAVQQLTLEEHLQQEVDDLKAEGILQKDAKVHMELDGEKLIGNQKVIDESKKKVSNGLLEQSRTGEVTYDIPEHLAFAQGDVLTEYDQHNVALDLVTRKLKQPPEIRPMHIVIEKNTNQVDSNEASKRLIAKALQHLQ